MPCYDRRGWVFGVAQLSVVGLLIGCDVAPKGTVIAVRGELSSPTTSIAPLLDPLLSEMDQELAAADAVVGINEVRLASGRLILDSTLHVKQGERLAALQQLGASEIASRLNQISSLQAAMAANSVLTPGELAQLTAPLAAATSGLQSLNNKIASDRLVDLARADIKVIATGFRVEGLLISKVRLMVAADELLSLVATYQREWTTLQQRTSERLTANMSVGDAPALLADMQVQLASATSGANFALATLPSLTPAGYPANRAVLESVRGGLLAARSAASRAGNDAIEIRAALAFPASPSATASASAPSSPAAAASSTGTAASAAGPH